MLNMFTDADPRGAGTWYQTRHAKDQYMCLNDPPSQETLDDLDDDAGVTLQCVSEEFGVKAYSWSRYVPVPSPEVTHSLEFTQTQVELLHELLYNHVNSNVYNALDAGRLDTLLGGKYYAPKLSSEGSFPALRDPA
jgi:hypothetical protein